MSYLALVLIVLIDMFLLGLAYRGKGGGWEAWGVLPYRPGESKFNPDHWMLRIGFPAKIVSSSLVSHGLAALIGGSMVMFINTHSYIAAALAFPAFFLLTKPDTGTGLNMYRDDWEPFLRDITQHRAKITAFFFYPADRGALLLLKLGVNHKIAAFYWWIMRMGVFGLPLAVVAHAFSAHHHPLGFLLLPLFAFGYLEGYVLKRAPFYRDPTEAGELAFGPYAAVVLCLLSLPLAQ